MAFLCWDNQNQKQKKGKDVYINFLFHKQQKMLLTQKKQPKKAEKTEKTTKNFFLSFLSLGFIARVWRLWKEKNRKIPSIKTKREKNRTKLSINNFSFFSLVNNLEQ